VKPETAAALEAVAARLTADGVPFLLGGSGLLHALGLDVPVRDIDLVVRPDARAAVEALPWWVTTTVEPTELMRSAWKATLDVDDVEVDAIGGLAWVADGRVATMPFRAEGTWRCGAVDVPLAPAAHWLLLYERYKPDRARLLAPLVGEGRRAAALAELGFGTSTAAG
jgi:hypothetical protein